MKSLWIFCCCLFPVLVKAQDLAARLQKAMQQLATDPQFAHAITGIYVADAKTGQMVFEQNSQLGFVPASCMKVVTSATAFELLGKDYRYYTNVAIRPTNGRSQLMIYASGDPSFGSWRWKQTKGAAMQMAEALQKDNSKLIGDTIIIVQHGFSYQPVPDGWVWQDMGNYYGAGAWALNWHENTFDWLFESGNKNGDSTKLTGFKPAYEGLQVKNLVTTGEQGSGDQGYIYSSPYNNNYFATGTVPPGEKAFSLSASMHHPAFFFISDFTKACLEQKERIVKDWKIKYENTGIRNGYEQTLCELVSPSFDTLNDLFMKKSINLYGEAFIKTIARTSGRMGATDTGVAMVRAFWAKAGIPKAALRMMDGSGLSPSNRITPRALVQVLEYAQTRPWFESFFSALPVMNGIRMKDGFITGIRSYTGFVNSTNGKKYVFALMSNNIDGSASTARQKLWAVLDLLK